MNSQKTLIKAQNPPLRKGVVSGSVLSFADWIEENNIPVLGHCKRNIKTYYLYNESIYNTDELFDEYRSCTDR